MTAAGGSNPLRWSDPALLRLGLFALTIFLLAWWRTEGYPLADAIGYVDRAKTFVDTGELQPAERNLRSFAFPFLFTPVFALCEFLGVEDLRFAMILARALQIMLAVLTVLASARLGARLYDRRVGLLGGFFVALSPTFIAHATMPVADIAAALYLAFAYERLVQDEDRRRIFWGGLAAGLSFLISYKTLVVHVLFGLLLFARDRFHRKRGWMALFAGLAACTMLQVAVDRVIYGRWGHSVLNYLYDNVFGTLTGLCYRAAGLIPIESVSNFLIDLGLRSYGIMSGLREYEYKVVDSVTQQMPPDWYLTHIYDFLVVPLIVLFACALVRAVFTLLRPAGGSARPGSSPRWAVASTLAIIAIYVLLLSQKGNKSFRLFIPLLPLWMPLVAWGWPPLDDFLRARLRGPLRVAITTAACVLVLGFTVFGFERTEPRAYGGYWQAIDYVNRRVEEAQPDRPVRVASAHYFAVFLRNGPNVLHERFRVAPWLWADDTRQESLLMRAQIRKTFSEVDWLLQAHTQLIGRPTLLRAAQSNFQIETAYYSAGNSEQVGPIYVMKRRDGPYSSSKGRSFYRLEQDVDVQQWRAAAGLGGEPWVFEGERDGGSPESLWLLGWDFENLPESDQGWMRFHWFGPTELGASYRIFVRWVRPDGTLLGASDHWPCYGELDTKLWRPGWVLTEGYLVDLDDLTTEPPPGAEGAPYYARVELAIATADARGGMDLEGGQRLTGAGADELGYREIGRVWKLEPGPR